MKEPRCDAKGSWAHHVEICPSQHSRQRKQDDGVESRYASTTCANRLLPLCDSESRFGFRNLRRCI